MPSCNGKEDGIPEFLLSRWTGLVNKLFSVRSKGKLDGEFRLRARDGYVEVNPRERRDEKAKLSSGGWNPHFVVPVLASFVDLHSERSALL